ncbi:MAG: cytochrome c oxidase subunit 4 [Sciscionella sp.]|nr:cytochrome c oxidase subunit 4 [Sciscionella sp.]
MKIEGRIFESIAVFAFAMAIFYGLWAKEPVGIIGLTLTGGLCLIIGTYFRFVARRVPPRPEDNDDADISDGAGDVGFFSAGSYWPVTLAMAAGFGALSFALWQTWLIVIAVVLILISVGGLVFEYHIGPNRTE